MSRSLIKCLLAVALLVAPSVATATDWYVDSSNDGGTENGTSWATAWGKLTDIVWASISAGDTIYISGGTTSKTYNQSMTIGASGSSGNPISIKPGQDSPHNGTVTITGTSTGINTNDKSWITINGNVGGNKRIRITGSVGHGIYTATGSDTGLVFTYLTIDGNGTLSDNHGIQLRGQQASAEISYCDIYNNYQDGINVYNGGAGAAYGEVKIHHNNIYNNHDDGIQGSRGMEIYNNTMHDQSDWTRGHPDGIQVSGTGNYTKIYNNTIYNFSNSAIFYDPQSSSSHIQIYNNVIYKDSLNADFNNITHMRAIIVYGDSATVNVNFDDVLVANNTLVDMGLWSLDVKYRTGGNLTNAIIANNLAYNCYTSVPSATGFSIGMTYDPSADNVQLRNNLVNPGSEGAGRVRWNSTTYTSVSLLNAATNSSGNSFSAPDFTTYSVRSSSNDFHLSSSDYAAKDTGIDLSAYFTTDLEGNVRSGTWDIGAYELSGVDATPSAFSFTDNTGVAQSTVIYSTSITVTGIDNVTSITSSGTGCSYQVNGAGDWLTTGGDNVTLNDNVAMKTTSSANYSTQNSCILTLNGNVSDTWTVTTEAAIEDVLPPTPPRMRAVTISGSWR